MQDSVSGQTFYGTLFTSWGNGRIWALPVLPLFWVPEGQMQNHIYLWTDYMIVQVGTAALVNWNEFVKRALPNERKAVPELWASVWSGLLSSVKVFPKYSKPWMNKTRTDARAEFPINRKRSLIWGSRQLGRRDFKAWQLFGGSEPPFLG